MSRPEFQQADPAPQEGLHLIEGGDEAVSGGDWRYRAACRPGVLAHDPDIFFAEGTGAADKVSREIAKAVCAACVSRPDCLEWALDSGEQNGIWGGLTSDELRAIRRRRITAARRGRC